MAEAQLTFGVVPQNPEAFFGLCHEEAVATSYLDEWRETFDSLRKSTCPGEIHSARPHPKPAFGVYSGAVKLASSNQNNGREFRDPLEDGRGRRVPAVTSLPHTAFGIQNKREVASPVHLDQLRAIPRDLCWLPLVIVVTKTELTAVVLPKSEKAPFEGEEERVVTKGH